MPNGPVYNHVTESGDHVVYKKTTAMSSTKSLWYHLKAAHSILPPEKPTPAAPAAKKPKVQQNLITTFVERKSQQEMYAQLAAEDRILFNQIACSDFISHEGQKAYRPLFSNNNPK